MQRQASTDQIDAIKARLAKAGTLTTANRGGWNGSELHDAWIDYNFGGQLAEATADRIIDFLDRQAARRTGRR